MIKTYLFAIKYVIDLIAVIITVKYTCPDERRNSIHVLPVDSVMNMREFHCSSSIGTVGGHYSSIQMNHGDDLHSLSLNSALSWPCDGAQMEELQWLQIQQ